MDFPPKHTSLRRKSMKMATLIANLFMSSQASGQVKQKKLELNIFSEILRMPVKEPFLSEFQTK